MAIFAVMSSNANPALDTAIKEAFPNDSLQVGPNQWLISAQTTTIELSTKLGITDGKNGTAIIVAISSYYGRAPTNVWEWIKNKWEGGPHG